MGLCFTAQTADGTQVFIGDTDASCNGPAPVAPAVAFNIAAGATATAAGSTTLTTTAAPAGVYIPPASATLGGFFLEFVATGSTVGVPVELNNSTAYVATNTSLTTVTTPLAVAANAVAQWPVPVRGVTTRNYNFNVAQVQSQASDSTGFAGLAPGQITATIDLTIEVSESAGYYNILRIAGKRETCWLKLVFPQGNTAIRGRVVEGIAMFSQLQTAAQDNNIMTMTTTAGFIRRPSDVYGRAA
jgi:hypothetical protein